MWSGTDVQYRAAFTSMLDYYMNQAEATASDPWDFRGRFNTDGSVWVSEYEATHTPTQFARLIGHLRDSSLTMPLNTCVQLYGAMPAEAVLRSFYYAGRLERREGLRFPLVIPMENQTLPGGVASLWAGSGARYSWKGICDCATCIDATNRLYDVYRFVGPDGQGVLMKWNSLIWNNQSIGGYAEAADPEVAMDMMQSNSSYLSRWPYDVRAAFGYGWDALQTQTDALLNTAYDRSNSSSRVIVSNEVDFFRDFEELYGASLPQYGRCFGNEWDLETASISEVTAEVKRAVEKLRTAEALATIASLHDPTFMAGREVARDSMTMGCGLYFEHSFSAGPGVTDAQRAAWERRIQGAITSYVNQLAADGLARLGSLVPAAPATTRFAVFNPLSWTRTDFVDLDANPAVPFHVVDVATGFDVPSQLRPGGGVRALVSGIPSVGYRVFELRSGAGSNFPPAVTVSGSSIDNGLYRITLGPRGQITSLLDHKDADRELVISGGAINDLGNGSGAVVVEDSGPASATLRVVAGGTPAHETRVTLYSGVDRIDVEDVVTQNFGNNEVAYASSFDLPGAQMRHEEVGMIARIARAENGGDYADENTRTDWLTLNHFVDLSQSTRGVTVSAWDSPFFRTGNSTVDHLDAVTPSIRCLVGRTEPCAIGIDQQNFDTRFVRRFALRTHGAWDGGTAMRLALEHQTPLVATPVTGAASAPLPATTWSMLSLDDPNVLLWALKPAEEGIHSGIIARVWNVADTPRTMTLALPPFGIAEARHATHIETDLDLAAAPNGNVTETLARQQMRTWRLFPAASLSVGGHPAPVAGLVVFPNPGRNRDAFTVALALARPARVHVTVHDLRGRCVATLANGPWTAGRHELAWTPQGLPPGVYFVRADVAGRVLTGRTVVMN
jgi:alpha-mannosidase